MPPHACKLLGRAVLGTTPEPAERERPGVSSPVAGEARKALTGAYFSCNKPSGMRTQLLQERDRGFFAEINTPEFLNRLRGEASERKKAFRTLVQSTHDALMQYARRQLSSSEECQECVQETFLAVHQGLDRFQGQSKLTTWMWSLAHHKICDRLGDKHRRRLVTEEPDDAHIAAELDADGWEAPTAWDAAPGRRLDRDRAARHFEAAIAALGEPAREVYLLRDVQGLSGDEVAEILGLSAVNVRVHLHRARHRIVEFVRARLESGAGPAGPQRSGDDKSRSSSGGAEPSGSMVFGDPGP